MANRRQLMIASLVLAGAASALYAQPPDKAYRVVYVTGSSQSARAGYIEAFIQGMSSHGYVLGRNFVFEARFADGDFSRLPALIQEAVKLKPDVLFASTTPASLAAKGATRSVPIVLVGVADPGGWVRVWELVR